MKYRLCFISNNNKINLDLEENACIEVNIDRISTEIVYGDKSYKKAKINFRKKIDKMEFYVNGTLKSCNYKNGYIHFNDETSLRDKIFLDYFGYVIISINITSDEKEYILTSKYIEVAIRHNIFSDTVREMIVYIMKNNDKLLNSDNLKSIDLLGLGENGNNNLQTRITVLNEIVFEYEKNYSFFRLNSRSRLVNNEKIDDFEKIKSISASTVRHILTNPQELYKVSTDTGIKYGSQYLLPRKTLISRNENYYNIYENKIVLGFLKFLYYKINNDIKSLSEKTKIKNNSQMKNSYALSAEEIKKILFTNLYNHKIELESINNRIKSLFITYKNTITCDEIIVNKIPKPTKTFAEITHYKKIYSVIVKWFKHAGYDFKKRSIPLSFLGNSQIYEYYVLLKLNNYFIKNNFKMENGSNHSYSAGKNKDIFVFQKCNSRVTIYYQPIISHSVSEENNSIGLFRNNNISFFSSNAHVDDAYSYYKPDYIIKKEENGFASYFIMDAKFSDTNTVKKRYLADIAYKYLCSISTINECDIIRKVCIINGKSSSDENRFYDVYNSGYSERNKKISPTLNILTLTSNIDDCDHMKDLNKLFETH